MVEWFEKPEIQELLTHIDPRLLFNADETEINRKSQSRNKVVNVAGKYTVVPRKTPGGQHVSLFIIISASRSVVQPYVVIHEEGDRSGQYADTWLDIDKVKYYRTKSGCMEQTLFKQILIEVFIPHVERTRELIGGPGKKAALVTDGHISRYFLESLELLRSHNIELVILPSNTSNVLQPLDLGLNRLIKSRFNEEFEKARPVIPVKDVSPQKTKKKAVPEGPRKRGRPPGRKNSKSSSSSAKPAKKKAQTTMTEQAAEGVGNSDQQPDTQQLSSSGQPAPQHPNLQHDSTRLCENERVCMAYHEKLSDTVERLNKTGYRRGKIIEAVLNAIPAALIPRNIKMAWEASHLFPFRSTPPGSEEGEEFILNQLTEEDEELVKSKKNRDTSVYKPGIVTSGALFEELKAILSTRSTKKVVTAPITVSLNTSRGPVTGAYHLGIDEVDATDCIPVPGQPDLNAPRFSGHITLGDCDKDTFSD